MKNALFLLAFIFCFGLKSQAQSYQTSIGLRLGAPVSVSVKHFLNEKGAIEGFLGFRRWRNYGWFNVGGMYQHHSQLTSDLEGLKWYWGIGASAFFWSFDDDFGVNDNANLSLGILGALGLDYKFDNAPVNLSIDWIPSIFVNGYNSGFGAGYGALSVRYVLK